MKTSRIVSLFLAICLVFAVFAFAACEKPDPTPEGRIGIKFLCESNGNQKSALEKMIKAYNDGQGEKDGVFVTATFRTGVSGGYENEYTKSKNYAFNVISVGDKVFRSFAIKTGKNIPSGSGYFLNLSPYAEKDSSYEKDGLPLSLRNLYSLTYDETAENMWAGQDQNIAGVPFTVSPHQNYYNRKAFEDWGIKVISVPEDKLDQYNSENNAKLMPHGYAEYKEAPIPGMTASKNLKGDDVYKVFNASIGMNWDEQRYIAKVFSKSYRTESPTIYGYDSEWWFSFGWSVGSDVMGWNSTTNSYDFTLCDKTPNYLVTDPDGVEVNGEKYAAKTLIRYEDKIKSPSEISTLVAAKRLTAVMSQYDAIAEFVSLTKAKGAKVDDKHSGLAIANPQSADAVNSLRNGTTAIGKANTTDAVALFVGETGKNFDIAANEQYREYVNGSVYYDGKEVFDNQYLKVIGETYSDGKYTGELRKVNGIPVVGYNASDAASMALVVPACSDPDKYQASWDFISWMVSAEAQKILAQNTLYYVPAQTSVAFGEFLNNPETNGLNYYALAVSAQMANVGDWGYFEDGTWVTHWSESFNNDLRKGTLTLKDFADSVSATAVKDLNNMVIRIKGTK